MANRHPKYITILKPAESVATATVELETEAFGEVSLPDPVNAEVVINNNETEKVKDKEKGTKKRAKQKSETEKEESDETAS